MATRNSNNFGDVIITFESLAGAATSGAVYVGDLDRIVIKGAGDGTTADVEGSIDGTTWFVILNDVALADEGAIDSYQVPAFIRVVMTGGTATVYKAIGTPRK